MNLANLRQSEQALMIQNSRLDALLYGRMSDATVNAESTIAHNKPYSSQHALS